MNEWFARNDAVRLKETIATDVLNFAKFDVAEPPLGSSSPCSKEEGGEVGRVDGPAGVQPARLFLPSKVPRGGVRQGNLLYLARGDLGQHSAACVHRGVLK